MIHGVIMDIDGTILDSMGIWDIAGSRYIRSLGHEPEPDLDKILFNMSIPEAAAYMKKKYGLSGSIQQIMQGTTGIVRDFYYYEVQLKPGAAAFLAMLKKDHIPTIAATSSNRDHLQKAFERLGIAEYFLQIITSEDAGAGKTKPDIYYMAARELSYRPDDLCVIEDALFALNTAKKAGFRTVGVFDRSSAQDTEKIKEIADLYLPSLEKQTEFENFFSLSVRKG